MNVSAAVALPWVLSAANSRRKYCTLPDAEEQLLTGENQHVRSHLGRRIMQYRAAKTLPFEAASCWRPRLMILKWSQLTRISCSWHQKPTYQKKLYLVYDEFNTDTIRLVNSNA